MVEEKVGVVRSRLKGTDFDLFFTPTRIVAVKTGSILLWGLLVGGIGQGIAMHLSRKRSQQLRELTIESLVTSDKKNFHVAYENISKVDLKKPSGLAMGKLTVHADVRTLKFILLEKKQFETDKEVIEKVFKDKVALS